MKYAMFLFILFGWFPGLSQDTAFLTRFEKNGRKETDPYAETLGFCRKLAAASPMIRYRKFGSSARGNDLPLLILDKDGLKDPYAIRSCGKDHTAYPGMHNAGECEGKDAG